MQSADNDARPQSAVGNSLATDVQEGIQNVQLRMAPLLRTTNREITRPLPRRYKLILQAKGCDREVEGTLSPSGRYCFDHEGNGKSTRGSRQSVLPLKFHRRPQRRNRERVQSLITPSNRPLETFLLNFLLSALSRSITQLAADIYSTG
jgi:hypothetical protein